MLNYIWLALIVLAVLIGGGGGRVQAVVDGAVEGAGTAVTLAIGLIGVMSLWLGLMRLAEKAGLVQGIARLLRPALRWLFPGVPVEHPAMGSMVMNMAANMLGLTNAATPLGLRAMRDLDALNPHPGTATNAMCTFLAINTSSVQLIPMTAVAILASAGSSNPSAIIGTALLATFFSTLAGITAVKLLEKLRAFRVPAATSPSRCRPEHPAPSSPTSRTDPVVGAQGDTVSLPAVRWWGWVMLGLFGAAFVWFFLTLVFPDWFGRSTAATGAGQSVFVRGVNGVSLLAIPFLVAFFPMYAALRRIPVYEEFVEGAKEGFQVAVRIIPFLVAMLVAIGMFRGSGGIALLTGVLQPALDLVGFPAELMPISLMRPLSGSASLGLFSELVKQFGPDSLLARTAGTLFGSTETTFYVIAVYFGAVGVKRTRHAVPAGLIADAVGIVASVVICRQIFG
jgi:spore maturation protein SpmA